jgi:uroporphyrinogen decarboxylase
VDVYAGDYLGRPKYMNRVIERPNQWEQLPVLDPHSGFLGQTLGVTRDIVAKLAGEYPVILTVFSPLTQAGNLAGIDGLMAQWKSEPTVVRAGLQTLTETILRQLRVLEDIGIDGIYLAVQECHWPGVDETGLLAEGHLLNRAILKAAPGWFQMVHVHGQGQHFADYARYPAQLLHWDHKMSGIGHAAGASQFPGIVSGSIVWPLSTEPNGEALIRSQVRQARKSPPRHRELLSSECVIPFETPPQWIEAFVDEADAD